MTTRPQVGFLHPGKMGSAMGAQVSGRGLWAGDGRSEDSRRRAEAAGLHDVGTVDALAAAADIIISICPPDAAGSVAEEVAAASFDGLYVDANAVSPATARTIADRFDRFVDGSVVGPPPGPTMPSRLYLSGAESAAVAELFTGTALEPRIIGPEPGQASALKMGYAGFTKGSAALVLDIAAFAEAEGVAEALGQEFLESQPQVTRIAAGAARGATPKAWRFRGEMVEIADAFAANELPDGFWRAAAELYGALDTFKNADPAPDLAAVTAQILESREIK